MANQIKVDTSKVDGYVQTLWNQIRNLERLSNNLDFYLQSKNYYSALSVYRDYGDLKSYSYDLQKNIDYLSTVVDTMRKVETQLSDFSVASDEKENIVAKTLSKMATKVGVPGSIYGVYKSFGKVGKGNALKQTSAWLGVGEKTSKAIKKIAGVVEYSHEKGVTNKKVLLKSVDWVPWEELEGAKDGWKGWLGEATFSGFDFLKGPEKKTVSEVAGWAADGLEFIGRTVDNFEENDNVVRAVSETISETVVDGVVTAGISTAVATGVAAIGTAVVGAPVAVPVLVVGATTAGIKCVADWVCEDLTGKEFTEWVSDGILDAGEAIVNGVADFGNAVADFGNSVADWFKDPFGKKEKMYNFTGGDGSGGGSGSGGGR